MRPSSPRAPEGGGQVHTADLVVVGSGIAGLSTALAAAAEVETAAGGDLRILLLTPGRFGGDGASALAQGGIAAALDAQDSPALHALDTARAGGGLTVSERVQILASEGPERVRELARLGVRFDRAADGSLALGLEGAHSRRRIAHALGDRTGWEVTRVLAETALHAPALRILEGVLVTSLRTGPRGVEGVRFRGTNGELGEVRATLTLLATGGACRLFLRTTAPAFAMGDGLALAARAGARLDGMEFVQFHPTALRVDADPLPLVTEALRGEGALLVDAEGRRLLPGGGAGELASRDEVARKLWLAMQEGVEPFLDARSTVGESFETRFPGVYRHCRAHGVDPVRDLIPVTPAAHYHMGGIAVDALGRTTVPGLRAAGEVASTGIHGANRLASNSLLEGLVYGRRAGRAMVQDVLAGRVGGAPDSRPLVAGLPLPERRSSEPGAGPTPAAEALLHRLRTHLWNGVGVVREARGLDAVLRGLDRLEREASAAGPGAIDALEHPLLVARAMTLAALARTESVGSHYRQDAPRSVRARPGRDRVVEPAALRVS